MSSPDLPNGKSSLAAIIPAYNEEHRISDVLSVISSYNEFTEIIVVDDGSADKTADIAKSFPVRVIRHQHNCGKGRAMETGILATRARVIFFCDADVRGLSHNIISETVAPVLSGTFDMMIAMLHRNVYRVPYIRAMVPPLGGVRAVNRNLWNQLPDGYKEGFRVEAALNFYARYRGNGLDFKIFESLTQTTKERKYGWRRGVAARMRMISDIILSNVRLRSGQTNSM